MKGRFEYLKQLNRYRLVISSINNKHINGGYFQTVNNTCEESGLF